MSEERELMARYCSGDASAFRELYSRIAPRLLHYLVHMSRDRALAEDLLQVTFLKVHRARGAYVQGADPMPWIYAIAHRTFLDAARKHKRSRVQLSRDGDGVPERVAHISGMAAEDVSEGDPALGRAAMEALERLPEKQRQAVVLTKLSGKTVAEAAAITGTTPGALKVRAHRGYAALRKALASVEAS
jgi:RNA polymerase sigma-70 factor, ECF subfamily